MRKKNTIKKIDKPDTAMKTFWRNNERFADLFNAVANNTKLYNDVLSKLMENYDVLVRQ